MTQFSHQPKDLRGKFTIILPGTKKEELPGHASNEPWKLDEHAGTVRISLPVGITTSQDTALLVANAATEQISKYLKATGFSMLGRRILYISCQQTEPSVALTLSKELLRFVADFEIEVSIEVFHLS